MSSSQSSSPTAYATVAVSPDPGMDLVLDAMEANEELGRPFHIVLDLSSRKPKGDLHSLLGSIATVTLTHPTKDTRYFSGIVARMVYRGLTKGSYRYRMELRPWIWLLSHQQDCRIFSSKSPWAIMTGLFSDAGFTDYADKRQNSSGDLVLDYCVQYRETTFAFVTRLMEQFGIYYYVTHANGSHTINFADDPNSHTALGSALPYQYDQTDWRTAHDHVWDWQTDAQIKPGAYTLREYNFTTPRADLTSKSLISGNHTYGSNEIYDYPGLYDTSDNGQTFAQIRMQDRQTQRQVFGATSNCREIGAGVKFSVSGFSDTSVNQEYLITQSTCRIRSAETRSFDDGDILDTYHCIMKIVPQAQQFRLAAITPRPMIRGPQTARVAGESGQEITTDSYGRIKVKFPWDRRTTEDENSSCWIRVAQTWAGASWGAMFIPRIGQEVVVEFLEGNPDRPLVIGSVYNADMSAPYTLPDNKTRSTVKSNSSQGGGGFNEFRFEDLKGSEEVFFQAQRDYNAVILNNQTFTITQDSTTTVKQGNRSVTVSQGNDTHTVSTGNRSVTVSQGNDSVTVSSGDHSITVSSGKTTVTAGTSISLTVGSNSIKIDSSGVTISAAKVSVSATGEMALSATGEASLSGAMVKIN